MPRIDCRTSQRPILKRSCYLAPLWCSQACKCLAAVFSETSRKLPGRQPAAPSKLENGPLRAAPINPGAKTTYRKVPSDLGHLAPLWRNLAHKCFAGNFLETSGKLPGRQPAAPQNLGMGWCALHQSIQGGNHPWESALTADLGCLAPLWCNLAHKCFAENFLETS